MQSHFVPSETPLAKYRNFGLGHNTVEVSWSHTHTHTHTHTVRLLWTSDQLRRRDLYLRTQNTHSRQTFMLPVGFELTISVGERPQTHALERAATGTGIDKLDNF